MTRLKKSRKVLCNPELRCSEEDLRFGTPETVARYRAERLRCNTLVEIGAGVGFQTVELAKKCKKVYALEVDSRKFNYLLGNIKKIKLKNVVLIKGDGLDKAVVKKVSDAEIAFVDTERLPSEKERSIGALKPDVKRILEGYSFCKGICIEVPPQTEKIGLDCEKEYISLYGQLNRLNLYFGKLKKCEKKVVALPEKETLESDPKLKLKQSKEALDYIYEISPAIVKARMIKEAAEGEALLYTFKSKNYLTSEKPIESVFLKPFKIVEKCKIEELGKVLKRLKAGKVILRGPIPENKFQEQTRSIEEELDGKLIYHVFLLGKALVCEIM